MKKEREGGGRRQRRDEQGNFWYNSYLQERERVPSSSRQTKTTDTDTGYR